MPLMQIMFLTIASAGLSYFLFAKREFDCFSIAFLSACAYFIPGFVGYTLMPTKTSMELPVDLEGETYLVMITVLVAISLGAILFDVTRRQDAIAVRLHGTDRSAMWAVSIALVGYL